MGNSIGFPSQSDRYEAMMETDEEKNEYVVFALRSMSPFLHQAYRQIFNDDQTVYFFLGYFLPVFEPREVFAINPKSKDDIYIPVVLLLLRNAPWMGNNNPNLGYPSQTERCEASIPQNIKKLAL